MCCVKIILLHSVFLNTVLQVTSWQFFTNLNDVMLSSSLAATENIHSEYVYGDCRNDVNKLYGHVHKDNIDVLGKVIIREWLKFTRIPTCIILRATAYEEDLFRNTAYNFQICVPRITYCHSQKRFKYYYYEWYIPHDMMGGMNWDLYFYGPPDEDW